MSYDSNQDYNDKKDYGMVGLAIIIIGILLLFFGCFTPRGGITAVTGIFVFWIGAIFTQWNRSRFTTKSVRETVQEMKDLERMKSQLDVINTLPSEMRGSAYVKMLNSDLQKAENDRVRKEANKQIVKDAVIGGVVAGPAGAVVGAIVGKNNADSKK